MLLDSQTLFSDAQVITATTASTNSYDASAIRNIGNGKPVFVFALVKTAFTDTGSDTTLTVTLEASVDAAFTSPIVVQTLFVFPALAPVGTKLFAAIAPGSVTQRYLQLRYTVANGNLTTGTISAGLTLTTDAVNNYANNVNID